MFDDTNDQNTSTTPSPTASASNSNIADATQNIQKPQASPAPTVASEPVDMFADTDTSAMPSTGQDLPDNRVAMDSEMPSLQSQMDPKVEAVDIESSMGKKVIIIVIIILTVAGIGFGTYWYYNKLLESRLEQAENVNQIDKDGAAMKQKDGEAMEAINIEQPIITPEDSVIIEPVISTPTPIIPVTPVVPVIPAPAIDVDNDGLTDLEELKAGTDPQKADTDDDGLTDLEELEVYKTDPNNPDTDGDTFLDGAEVKNGYNPNGEGKLLIETSTT